MIRLVLILLCAPLLMAQETPPELVQQRLVEWVRAKKSLAAERASWTEEQQRLADLNDVRRTELSQLNALLTNVNQRAETEVAKREKLVEQRTTLRSEQVALAAQVAAWEASLIPQLISLPPILHRRLAEPIARIRRAGAGDGKLQDRARDVLYVLGEISAFHHTLTLDTEARELDGSKVELELLYLGLTQAWFVDRANERAGRYLPGPDGWVWQDEPELAPAIRRAIRMARKEEAPDFLRLPVPGGQR